MMTDLFLDLGNPTMKSIEISLQIVGGIRSSWSVPGSLTIFPYCIDMYHIQPQRCGCLFHTVLEKIMFDPFIGFGKP
jgi:hypothetical protein